MNSNFIVKRLDYILLIHIGNYSCIGHWHHFIFSFFFLIIYIKYTHHEISLEFINFSS